jgi:tetratricopeptide (TPR) repeat protein
MPVQPYDACPCGSGKKFKWCCQKVVKFGERAEQMLEKGQTAAAMQAIDEGLAIDPTNNWLRLMKVHVLLSQHDHDAAQPLIQNILETQPGHRAVLALRLQDELSHGMIPQSISTLQELLDSVPASQMSELSGWIRISANALSELHEVFAALALLRLLWRDPASQSDELERSLYSNESRPEVLPWERNEWELRPAPLGAAYHERFSNAVALAKLGRWQRAVAILEAITVEAPESADAWFNLGLCQGWLGQSHAAANSLERYARLEQNAERAVDAMALAQCLDLRESAQSVDVVRVRYPIRDHSRLIQQFKDHPRLQVHALDARQGELGEGVKDEFYLLNKDFVKDPDAVTIDNVPAIVGFVRTRGRELEVEFAAPVDNDPRPELVVQAAAETIDPSGDRSVVGTIPLSQHLAHQMWGIPSNGSPASIRRIRQLVYRRSYTETWPNTPQGWLGNRTPREAAQVAELKLPLRAAILLIEQQFESSQLGIGLDELSRELAVDPEPMIAGDHLDIGQIPLPRLRYVQIETLTLVQLRELFTKASHFNLALASERSAAALVKHVAEHEQFDYVSAFQELVDLAKRRGDRAEAERWLNDARQFDSEIGLKTGRASWEIAEWELSLMFDAIAEWAPRLARLMTRTETDPQASQQLTLILVRAGILRLMQHPSDPKRVTMDTRLLETILSRYSGAQSSMLDLSPVSTQPGKIWTPADEIATAQSSIMLPGQEPTKPRSKLVIPGA